MPFPSVQGTQAAVRAMLDAEHSQGLAPELLTYAHGGFEARVPWPLHRIGDLVRDRSLRSGPSWRKVVQDAQLVIATRRAMAAIHPGVVVAHHVEAMAACAAARARPLVFVAHTALGPELPTYLPPSLEKLARRSGEALDVVLVRLAGASCAVSPALATHLASASGRPVDAIPIPWTLARPIEADERPRARARFGLEPLDAVLLYAGNLDAYQGLDVLVAAFARVKQRLGKAKLIVATESPREAIEGKLLSAGMLDATVFAPLADEPDRRAVHAAADAALVVRGAFGGLPIKLLDALARGVPTIATRRAAAGLELGGGAIVVADGDPDALAASALLALSGRDAARAIAAQGTDYVRREHSSARYLDAILAVRARAVDAAR